MRTITRNAPAFARGKKPPSGKRPSFNFQSGRQGIAQRSKNPHRAEPSRGKPPSHVRSVKAAVHYVRGAHMPLA